MELWGKLGQHPSSTVRQLAGDSAGQKAYYRFLNNGAIKEDGLINESSGRMGKLYKGRHLPCIQDTGGANIANQKERLKADSGLGRSDNSGTGHCFKVRPGLVLDAKGLGPLGFSRWEGPFTGTLENDKEPGQREHPVQRNGCPTDSEALYHRGAHRYPQEPI